MPLHLLALPSHNCPVSFLQQVDCFDHQSLIYFGENLALSWSEEPKVSFFAHVSPRINITTLFGRQLGTAKIMTVKMRIQLTRQS